MCPRRVNKNARACSGRSPNKMYALDKAVFNRAKRPNVIFSPQGHFSGRRDHQPTSPIRKKKRRDGKLHIYRFITEKGRAIGRNPLHQTRGAPAQPLEASPCKSSPLGPESSGMGSKSHAHITPKRGVRLREGASRYSQIFVPAPGCRLSQKGKFSVRLLVAPDLKRSIFIWVYNWLFQCTLYEGAERASKRARELAGGCAGAGGSRGLMRRVPTGAPPGNN